MYYDDENKMSYGINGQNWVACDFLGTKFKTDFLCFQLLLGIFFIEMASPVYIKPAHFIIKLPHSFLNPINVIEMNAFLIFTINHKPFAILQP